MSMESTQLRDKLLRLVNMEVNSEHMHVASSLIK